MKKIITALLLITVCLVFFGCSKEGDLGKQTTVDKENGYTIVQEVVPFSYNNDEDELEKNKNVKTDGFVTGEKNPAGAIKVKSDALNIAKKEINTDYNKINYNYDRTQGVWKIVFSYDMQSDGEINSEQKAVVYVDEDGYTLAVVQ